MTEEFKLIGNETFKKEYDYLKKNFFQNDFLQVNHDLLRLLGPEYAVWLTFLWSKARFYSQEKQLVEIKLKNENGEFLKDKDGNFIKEEGYFYLYQGKIYQEIGIPPHKQRNIIKDMIQLEILKVEEAGVPKRHYYKINEDKIIEYCAYLRANEILSLYETKCHLQKSRIVRSRSHESLAPEVTNREIKKSRIVRSRSHESSPLIIYNNYIKKDNIIKVLSKDNTNDLDKSVSNIDKTLLDNKDSLSQNTNILSKENTFTKNKQSLKEDITKSFKQKDNYSAADSPKFIDEIVSLWNALGLQQHKSKTTKTFQTIISYIKKLKQGTMFNHLECFKKYHNYKFTDDEIKEVIRQFSYMALNPDYEPIGSYKDRLKKTSLSDFIYNPRAPKQKSLFMECFLNKPKVLDKEMRLVKDTNPELTEFIKKSYIKGCLGGVENSGWSSKDENNFRRCSQKLLDFFSKNGKRINKQVAFGMGMNANKGMAELLIEAIQDQYGEKTITTGFLSSTNTINVVLPAYLSRQGVLYE